MKEHKEQVISDIFAALKKAEQKHPGWPDDVFEQLAIIGEEFGELQKAVLHVKYEGGLKSAIYEEGCQVAAMGIRFMLNIDEPRCFGSKKLEGD